MSTRSLAHQLADTCVLEAEEAWPTMRHLDFAKLCGSARRVELQKLSDGDQVRIEKECIL